MKIRLAAVILLASLTNAAPSSAHGNAGVEVPRVLRRAMVVLTAREGVRMGTSVMVAAVVHGLGGTPFEMGAASYLTGLAVRKTYNRHDLTSFFGRAPYHFEESMDASGTGLLKTGLVLAAGAIAAGLGVGVADVTSPLANALVARLPGSVATRTASALADRLMGGARGAPQR